MWRPLPADVEAARGHPAEGELVRGAETNARLDDEPLEERPALAAGTEPRGLEPLGDAPRGPLAAGGAGAPALHLGRGEGFDVARQGLRGRREDEGAGGAGGCAEEQERDQQRERRAATGHGRYFTPRMNYGNPTP